MSPTVLDWAPSHSDIKVEKGEGVLARDVASKIEEIRKEYESKFQRRDLGGIVEHLRGIVTPDGFMLDPLLQLAEKDRCFFCKQPRYRILRSDDPVLGSRHFFNLDFPYYYNTLPFWHTIKFIGHLSSTEDLKLMYLLTKSFYEMLSEGHGIDVIVRVLNDFGHNRPNIRVAILNIGNTMSKEVRQFLKPYVSTS